MERPEDFRTDETLENFADTELKIPVFAAMHIGIAEPDDRCVSIAVGQCAASFRADVARKLGTMLIQSADYLDSGRS